MNHEPQFMSIYRRPAASFIKAAVVAWSVKSLPWDGTELQLFVAFLNDTLDARIGMVDVIEVLDLLNQLDDIDAGTHPFETHCKDPERAIEESDARDNLDDLINSTIQGML